MVDAPRGVRIAVTGIGAVTPLGLTWPSSWAALQRGQSGADAVQSFDASALPVRIAAEVKEFDPVAALGRKEARRSSRATQFALVAAREAVADAGLDVHAEPDDVGVLVASGIGGFELTERAVLALAQQGPRRVSPFASAAILPDMPAGAISIDLGARGPNFAVVSACASGAHAIGEAAAWIARGDAVAVIAGGTEAGITPTGLAMFAASDALSKRNDDPRAASRPFDSDRDGFVAAEGAAVLVLEDEDHARRRGARILGRIAGYGASADAYHITQPDPTAAGARRCVERAMWRAQVAPTDLDYINAHGTSTRLNDAAEAAALRAALGDAVEQVPVSSTKSMTGHLLGAAGALEAAIALGAIRDHFIPPTINLDHVDPECAMCHVPHKGVRRRVRTVLSTSFGFGGHNAALVITSADASTAGGILAA